MESNEGRPSNCTKQHWNQLKIVLDQEAKIELYIRMTKACSLQKNAHCIGHVGETRIVECLVCVFAFFVIYWLIHVFFNYFVHYVMQFFDLWI
jgi:hypothetical protein